MASNTGCTSDGEAGDDLQDLGRAGLALERLVRLPEQPRVLDRDHRLVGEGLEQRLFLGVEDLQRLAADEDRADRAAFPDHRRDRQRVVLAVLRGDAAQAVGHVRVVQHVGVGDHPALAYRQFGRRAFERHGKELARALDALGVRPTHGREVKQAVVADQEHDQLTAAEEPLATHEDLLEHRLRVGHRGADHLQDVGGRGLALQRLAASR